MTLGCNCHLSMLDQNIKKFRWTDLEPIELKCIARKKGYIIIYRPFLQMDGFIETKLLWELKYSF